MEHVLKVGTLAPGAVSPKVGTTGLFTNFDYSVIPVHIRTRRLYKAVFCLTRYARLAYEGRGSHRRCSGTGIFQRLNRNMIHISFLRLIGRYLVQLGSCCSYVNIGTNNGDGLVFSKGRVGASRIGGLRSLVIEPLKRQRLGTLK